MTDHGSSQGDDSLVEDTRSVLERYLRVRAEFMTWSTQLGPVRLKRVVGTNGIFLIFLVWHLLALAAGVVATLVWDGTRELGIALVVGALFGIGSFISQVWSQGMDREREFIMKVEHEDTVEQFRAASKEMREIESRIQRYLQDD